MPLPSPTQVMRTVMTTVKETKDDSEREISALFMEKPSQGLYPAYYEMIKRPIDIQTMEQKIDAGQYELPAARTADIFGGLDADMELMIANCKIFNPPESLVVVDAEALHHAYREAKMLGLVALTAQAETWKGLPKSCGVTDRTVPDTKARCRAIINVLLESGKYKQRMAEKLGNMTQDELQGWLSGHTHGVTLETVSAKLDEVGPNAVGPAGRAGYPRVSSFATEVHIALNNMVELAGFVTKAERAAAKAATAQKYGGEGGGKSEEKKSRLTLTIGAKKTTFTVGGKVSFQWNNPDFLLKNPDFQLKNPDFLLKNVDFVTKQGKKSEEEKKVKKGKMTLTIGGSKASKAAEKEAEKVEFCT